jgi:single-strand DNA-binding protein
MGYLNKVLLIGRIGQEPEKRITPTGQSVVNISLATTEYFKDKSGNKQDRTEWHRIVLWNRLAEIVEQYCHKGSQLYVEGSIQTKEWQDKDGNKRYTTEIIARNIQLLDSKGQGASSGFQDNRQSSNQFEPYNPPSPSFQNQQEPSMGSGPVGSDDFIEDDIPF